ncbi:16S rRNA (cytosine(1402)-N(4))-methyltransferase RsmH [Candidatus Gracilibacteria bacterium]|nr:16S rRNA (cytosine(1402)-N(4))-methyltransferase RsmH [Candidatus Gracilibacteria bacterium]
MHTPVLLEKVLNKANLEGKKNFIDGTLGLGGHSKKIFEKFPQIKIFGIDQDEKNILLAKKNLEKIGKNLKIIKNNFANIEKICEQENIKGEVDCILLDIGVASTHFDQGERGFSFQNDGPLDMRMDTTATKTARNVINNYHEQDLFIIFKKYGEEPSARKIAKKICEKRKIETIKTSEELKNLIAEIINPKFLNSTLKRIFQAIRIEVNDELGVLEKGLEGACEVLAPGGRIIVISYHSLEDRIVKKFFRNEEKNCICPPIVPICICNKKQRLKITTKKPIIPTEEEIEKNPRSRSAKMRIAEKI